MDLFLIVFLIIGLLPLYLGPKLAKNKNRSAGKAFLLCFFLGWIGVLIIMVLEEKQICEKCNAKFPANNLVCGNCGESKVKNENKN